MKYKKNTNLIVSNVLHNLNAYVAHKVADSPELELKFLTVPHFTGYTTWSSFCMEEMGSTVTPWEDVIDPI